MVQFAFSGEIAKKKEKEEILHNIITAQNYIIMNQCMILCIALQLVVKPQSNQSDICGCSDLTPSFSSSGLNGKVINKIKVQTKAEIERHTAITCFCKLSLCYAICPRNS